MYRWTHLHQLQLVTTNEAYQCLSSASGRKSGCRTVPRLGFQLEEDDQDDGCDSVTGHVGPTFDMSKLQRGKSMIFTIRQPASRSSSFTLNQLCDQNVLPEQAVRGIDADPNQAP
jgi:hypothetical protein